MHRLIGEGGATAVALVVLISTLGSTHGSIITGARITYAQARDGLLFRFLGRVHPRFGTPAVSLWFQCLLGCAAVWYAGDFASLAGAFVFTMWIFYGLAAAVLFIMRYRHPDVPRPYRCWGYPIFPALFIAASIAMTPFDRQDPRPAASGLRSSPVSPLQFLGQALPCYATSPAL
jgi:APA family basic amino acid/polyamine antiporter